MRIATAGVDAEYQLPVTSLLGRRFATVVRQQYDFSCGSAALATLLTYHYDTPVAERTTFLGMWQGGDQGQIRTAGFSLLDMKRYLARGGISADGYQVNLEQIAQTKVPGIVLVNFDGYRHFVVVKGVEGRDVLIGDPALGLRRISRSEFLETWNGVYFVINSGITAREVAFDRAGEFALLPTAPLAENLLPVSIQALALTRLLPGEF